PEEMDLERRDRPPRKHPLRDERLELPAIVRCEAIEIPPRGIPQALLLEKRDVHVVVEVEACREVGERHEQRKDDANQWKTTMLKQIHLLRCQNGIRRSAPDCFVPQDDQLRQRWHIQGGSVARDSHRPSALGTKERARGPTTAT